MFKPNKSSLNSTLVTLVSLTLTMPSQATSSIESTRSQVLVLQSKLYSHTLLADKPLRTQQRVEQFESEHAKRDPAYAARLHQQEAVQAEDERAKHDPAYAARLRQQRVEQFESEHAHDDPAYAARLHQQELERLRQNH